MSVLHPKTIDDFNKIVSLAFHDEKQIVIDFMAKWCGPCKALAPMFVRLAETYKNQAVFIKVDVDELESLAATFKVTAMPTIVIASPTLSQDKKSISLKVTHTHVGGSGVHVFLEGNLSKP